MIRFILAAGLAAAPLAAQACYTAAEWQAADVRAFEIDMENAALACHADPAFGAAYQALQSKQAAALAHADQTLQRYYRRSYGAAATRNYDRFVTQIANRAAQRGSAAGFCDQQLAALRGASQGSAAGLQSAATGHAELLGVARDLCPGRAK